MALPVNSSELVHGKVVEWEDGMAKNGNPEPLFYTDEERTLFLVTLPCHIELKGTKSDLKGIKSENKLSLNDINSILIERFDFQSLSRVLENDINDIKINVRDYIGTKSGTKSGTKLVDLIDFLSTGTKSRSELLEAIGLFNKTGNFNNYIKPFIEIGIMEMTQPDKPNSQHQKYRLTEKGKKLLK